MAHALEADGARPRGEDGVRPLDDRGLLLHELVGTSDHGGAGGGGGVVGWWGGGSVCGGDGGDGGGGAKNIRPFPRPTSGNIGFKCIHIHNRNMYICIYTATKLRRR